MWFQHQSDTCTTTQSQHRAIQINKEATQNDAGLHRIWTEHFQDYTESTQSQHGVIPVYTEATQNIFWTKKSDKDLHRIYTDSF